MNNLPGKMIVVEQTASTNELALRAIDEQAPAGTVFVADAQSAGRGRREVGGQRRRWFSPPGKNLYLSLIARPDLALDKVAPITLAVGAALADFLAEDRGVDLWLKWPNDLYVGDRKLAGILTEGVTGAQGLEAVVIGLGLNVNTKADDFVGELKGHATSLLAETGRVTDRLDLALKVTRTVMRACAVYESQGLDGFRDRLERFDRLSGRALQVRENGAFRRGTACGIGRAGGLRVEFSNGEIREVEAGEVHVDGLGPLTAETRSSTSDRDHGQ